MAKHVWPSYFPISFFYTVEGLRNPTACQQMQYSKRTYPWKEACHFVGEWYGMRGDVGIETQHKYQAWLWTHGWQSESTDGPKGGWGLLSFSLSLSLSFSDSWERVRCKHDVPKCGKLLIMKLGKYQQKQAQKPEAQKHKPKHSPDVCRCTQSARKSQKTFAQLLNQSGAIHVGWALWPSLVISQCMGCPSCKTAGRVLRIAWKWPCWSAPRCIADRLTLQSRASGNWQVTSGFHVQQTMTFLNLTSLSLKVSIQMQAHALWGLA